MVRTEGLKQTKGRKRSNSSVKIVGVTGGIGSGKSTVSDHLRERGYDVVDADAVARAITGKGSPVVQELADRLGAEILRPDGSLDRAKTARLVFSDPGKKKILEDIVTERAIDRCGELLDECRRTTDKALVFYDAPVLFETRAHELTDENWVVTADHDIRIRRVMARDGVSEQAVEARMANQMSDAEKCARADAVLDNSGSREELIRRVDALLERAEAGRTAETNF